MRQIFKGKITWVDITCPVQGDIEYLRKNYRFHPIILEELKMPSQRNKTEAHDGYIFLVTHFPCWNAVEKRSSPWELDIILDKNTLITICYEKSTVMREELMEKVYTKDFENLYLNDTIKLLYFIIEYFWILLYDKFITFKKRLMTWKKKYSRVKQKTQFLIFLL